MKLPYEVTTLTLLHCATVYRHNGYNKLKWSFLLSRVLFYIYKSKINDRMHTGSYYLNLPSIQGDSPKTLRALKVTLLWFL